MSVPITAAPPVRFDADGLVPVVVQDATSKDVLILAFMNAEALDATRRSGRTHFWSRTRQRLWRKGESSGHEQIVRGIFVNCEQNSLLITVDQIGVACHNGYSSCYYRALSNDDRLVVVQEREFDPSAIYPARSVAADEPLSLKTQLLYHAFAYLRDHDLVGVSSTSAVLRLPDDQTGDRVAEEMAELAGVLDGTHRHTTATDDVLLEATQTAYWIMLAALRAGVPWDELRPDRALRTTDDELDGGATARLLRAEARRWSADSEEGLSPGARCHAALALVGQACQTLQISVEAMIEGDLAAARTKPYLTDFFLGNAGSATGGRGSVDRHPNVTIGE